jgi:hypothetical protein
VNVTDHDSRVVRTYGQPPLQGYNAQMAVDDQQHAAAPGENFGGPGVGWWGAAISGVDERPAVTRTG